jgi:predicted transcriptional regulator of viral defense system
VEAFALALAVADYGPEAVTLMGVSAARHHGAVPRAVAVAVVAVPRQRPPLLTPFGEIVFAQRDTDRLATELTTTPLVTGPVTTVEQTLLDLADRPGLGGLRPREVGEAITALALRSDWAEVLDLARRQRLHAAYVRGRWAANRVLDAPPPAWPPRQPVDGLDLVSPRPDDTSFGIDAHAAA